MRKTAPTSSHAVRTHLRCKSQRCARQHSVSWLRCSRQHRRRIESDTGRCHFAACRHRQRTASPYANQLAPLFVDNENSSAIAAVEISCGRHRRTPTQLAPYTPEVENPGRVRNPGRHPIPTRSPPLLACRHQKRGNASAIVIRRLAQRRDSNQPSGAPAASPQAKVLKLLKSATSPATNSSTRRKECFRHFRAGPDRHRVRSGRPWVLQVAQSRVRRSSAGQLRNIWPTITSSRNPRCRRWHRPVRIPPLAG